MQKIKLVNMSHLLISRSALDDKQNISINMSSDFVNLLIYISLVPSAQL